MHRTPSPTAAFWLAAFTYFIWGFTFLASRIAQDYGTPFVLLFWRFALAFLLLNLLRLTGHFPVRFRSRKLWPVLLAGLFEPVLYFPCEQYGLKLTSTSFSGVMVALIPLCSLVYGAIFLHEKATWRQVAFSVLSVAGVIVLAVYATGIGAGSFLGFLILLGTVFAGAGYMVACRACSGSFTAFERTYITCGMGAAAFFASRFLPIATNSLNAIASSTTPPPPSMSLFPMSPLVITSMGAVIISNVTKPIAVATHRALSAITQSRSSTSRNLSNILNLIFTLLIYAAVYAAA